MLEMVRIDIYLQSFPDVDNAPRPARRQVSNELFFFSAFQSFPRSHIYCVKEHYLHTYYGALAFQKRKTRLQDLNFFCCVYAGYDRWRCCCPAIFTR